MKNKELTIRQKEIQSARKLKNFIKNELTSQLLMNLKNELNSENVKQKHLDLKNDDILKKIVKKTLSECSKNVKNTDF